MVEVQGKCSSSNVSSAGLQNAFSEECPKGQTRCTPKEPRPMTCPECGSTRIFNDGFRKAPLCVQSNKPIQRYRCADYGHKFSQHLSEQSFKKELAYKRSSQISVIPQDMKNLTHTQEIKTCAEKGRQSPTENEIKAWLQIEKFLIQLKNDGRTAGTVLNYRKMFRRFLKANADLYTPENVKAILADLPNKPRAKKMMVAMLSQWFDFNEIKWRPPKYSGESEIPYIPTETQLDTLIAALGKRTSTFCQILKETGARPGEIAETTLDSINFQMRTIRIKAEKGSNSRILPLSPKVIDMISNLSLRNGKLFSKADSMRTTLFLQKRRIAKKLAASELNQISFKTFRHWKGTMEQHRTKDPWHVKMILGHKSITSTETYIHIEKMIYNGEPNDQFMTKVALTVGDACKLIDVGFEYVTGEYNDGGKIFRKRK